MKTKKLLPFLFSLLVALSPLLVSAQQPNLSLTVATNKQEYCGYNPITISGSLKQNNNPISNGLVAIQIQDSQGKTLIIRTINTETATLPDVPIQITSAYLSDSSQNPKSTTKAGTLAYFAITLSNTDSMAHNMIVAVCLFDSDGIPIGQISQPCALLAGKNSPAILGIPIPSWAHSGTVRCFANVYDDMPSNNGVPLAIERSFDFTLIAGATSKVNALSSHYNQGAYGLTFCFPTMGPANVRYTIYTSSVYAGVTTTKSTSINCEFGDFNSDGAVDYTDVFTFADSYIKYCSGSNDYNSLCNMNQDGKLDSEDFFRFVNTYITYWSKY